MDIELQDMSHGNGDPPPAYTDRGPDGYDDPPPPYTGIGTIPQLCGIYHRRTCADPCSRSFPGVCSSCFIKLLFCLIIYLATFFVTVATLAMLTKGTAWKEVLIVVMIAAFLLMCIRLSFAVSEALARFCRICQSICIFVACMLSELFKNEGASDPLGSSDSHGPVQAPQMFIIIFVCLAIVMGILTLAYYIDCFWHGPKLFLVSFLILTVTFFLLAVTAILVLPTSQLSYGLVICSIFCLFCPWVNAGKTAVNTCAFLHQRYSNVGHVGPFGSAVENNRSSGRPGRSEDDVPCTSMILSCLMSLLVLIMMILAIPAVCGWIRMQLKTQDRQSHAQVLSVSCAGVIGGMGLGFSLPSPPMHSAPLCSPTKLALLLLICIVIVLVIFAVTCALILYCVTVGVMFALVVSLLRNIGKSGLLLPLAAVFRVLLMLLLMALSMTSGISFLLDAETE